MTRPAHLKKEVEDALKHAERQGWRIEVCGSHAHHSGWNESGR